MEKNPLISDPIWGPSKLLIYAISRETNKPNLKKWQKSSFGSENNFLEMIVEKTMFLNLLFIGNIFFIF